MCINPFQLKTGDTVPCGKCWACRTNRKFDLVGRAFAEAMTSNHVLVGTLTYSNRDLSYEEDQRIGAVDGNVRAKLLHYGDCQEYWQRLRDNTGGTVRYICAGEYSPAKQRAHWHIVLFLEKRLPNVVFEERYMHGPLQLHAPMVQVKDVSALFWPHGWVFWSRISSHEDLKEKIIYDLKYALKGETVDRRMREQHAVYCSKKPPLGAEYLKMEARKYVDAGLPLQSRRIVIGPSRKYVAKAAYAAAGLEWNAQAKRKQAKKEAQLESCRLSKAAYDILRAEYVRYFREKNGHDDWPVGVPNAHGLGAIEDWMDSEAARKALPDEYFTERFRAGLQLRAELRAKGIERIRFDNQLRRTERLAMRHGLVDDALNAALADMPEQEWRRRFGSFEEHEKRWQMEAVRRTR